VKTNPDGITIVHEEWDSRGNYVVYMEDGDNRIIEVYDYMGYITTTTYAADGTSESVKTDENGNEVQEGYYDDDDNYIIVYFDQGLNTDVTMTTDPWGYYSIEYVDANGDDVYQYFDPTGVEVVVLPVATPPQNVDVGDQATGTMYHITWEAPADTFTYDVLEYSVYWDDYSYGEWFMPVAWLGP
jgi:hypothetical protein